MSKTNIEIIKKVEKNITIIIPSKIVDDNLKNCIKKIRKFYKKIKIIIILDLDTKAKFDKNIEILISGNKTIGFKRNLAAKIVKTKLISLIDSDAFPYDYWLNDSLSILKDKKIAAIGGANLSPQSKNLEKILVAKSRRQSIVTLDPKTKSINTKKQEISFLPSCNFIIKTSIYKKVKGMDARFYSGEEISLNYKIKKKKLKIIFDPKISVFHKERNFKHFFRQRFIYGSSGLWQTINYPCRESFLTLIASLPTLFVLSLPIIFINKYFKTVYILLITSLCLLILINTFKINYKNNYLSSLKLSLISFFGPGLGLIARLFLADKNFKKLYTQK